jgi:hypothetical protein
LLTSDIVQSMIRDSHLSWRLPFARAKGAMIAKFRRVTFTGESGRDYSFAAYSRDTRFKPIAAVYVITKREANAEGRASHTRLYVGQTDNLQDQPLDHGREQCFDRKLPTACASFQRTIRIGVLLSRPTRVCDPPCNRQQLARRRPTNKPISHTRQRVNLYITDQTGTGKSTVFFSTRDGSDQAFCLLAEHGNLDWQAAATLLPSHSPHALAHGWFISERARHD